MPFSYRILFLTTLISGSLVHWHWKTSLIANLAVVRPHIPFSNLQELVDSPYQITLERNSAQQEEFAMADTEIYSKLWQKKFEDPEKSLTNSNKDSAHITATVPHYTAFIDQYCAMNLHEYNSGDLKATDVKGRKSTIAFMMK